MAADSRKTLRDLVFHTSGFVMNPLQWTSRHLDLVGCRFEDLTLAPSDGASTPDNCSGQKKGSDRSRQELEAERLPRHMMFSQKRVSLSWILIGKERPFTNCKIGPSFYFQGRSAHQPEYAVFNRHHYKSLHPSITSPLSIGYVHYSNIIGDRRRRFQPCRGPKGDNNDIGVNICLNKLRRLTPKDWTADPYYLCHLLALAQQKLRRFGSQGRTSYTSRILVTHIQHRDVILLCEAEIPIEVLKALENPKMATNPITWPTIHRKQIFFQPYHTFADRLTAELIAPPISENGMFNDRNPPDGQINGAPDTKRPRPEIDGQETPLTETDEQERQKRHRKQ